MSRVGSLAAAVAASGLLCQLLLAQDPASATTAELIAKIRSMRQRTNFRASGRLVRVEQGGERKAYQISMKGRASAAGVSIFAEVTDPASARVRVLMETRAGAAGSIRLGHPGEPEPKELAFANWGDPLLDSDLSYEDLMEGHFFWGSQALLKEAPYGARRCYVLRSQPSGADRSHYSSVTAWLDRQITYPVKVEKVLKRSGVVKEFLYYGLRQSNGLWSAGQVEVRTKGQSHSTFLIINRGSAKANLSDRDFDPKLLTSAR
jgi:hypothetical protein